MRRLRDLEGALTRVESALAVVLVLVMLALAAYNVAYRNVLVPLQQHWAHSGPPLDPAGSSEPSEDEAAPGGADAPEALGGAVEEPSAAATTEPDGAEGFGGFGGGLEDDGASAQGDAPTPGADGGGDFGGFGGGLDDEPRPAEPESAAPPPPDASAEPRPAADEGFGGFGGGFGEAEQKDAATDKGLEEAVKGSAADEGSGEAEQKESAEDEGSGEAEQKESAADEGFGGFGGGFGEAEQDEAKDEAATEGFAADDFGGFGGGLDGGTPREASGEADGGADDFGGGLGAEGPLGAPTGGSWGELGDDDLGDEEDPFANMPDIDAVGQDATATATPAGGPPPEGSFAAWGVAFIDDIKLDWIDIFLRQLVIIVSFLGAALATPRRKHINIDALSKVLPASARRAVGIAMPAFALVICLVLARAGWDLVQVSREYPKDLLPFATEWQMQLMFPVGFGLLALHFAVQVAAAATELDPPSGAAPVTGDEGPQDAGGPQ